MQYFPKRFNSKNNDDFFCIQFEDFLTLQNSKQIYKTVIFKLKRFPTQNLVQNAKEEDWKKKWKRKIDKDFENFWTSQTFLASNSKQ